MSWHRNRWLGPLRLYLIALQFLTRLPVPHDLNPTTKDLAKASALFPLVGLFLGGLLAILYQWLYAFLPLDVVCALLVILSVLLTGAFHEDGLADTADGLFGGFSRTKRLEIMRDSRVGTYGALALVLLCLVRFACLQSIHPDQVSAALMAALTLGRWTSLPMILALPYARSQEGGVAKPLIEGIGWTQFFHASGYAGLILLLLVPLQLAVASVLAVFAVCLLSGLLYGRKIQGVTGDSLGATNVLAEVSVLILYSSANHLP